MAKDSDRFEGFFKETADFFLNLKANNNKEWFEENKKSYKDYVLNPAQSFIVDMGQRLRELSPTINADPRTNKSLFRINRDTRFSKDKSPYKTTLAFVFWDGNMQRMEASSFYFQFEISGILLGAGIYRFTKSQLKEYRDSVVNPVYGKELSEITGELEKKGYGFGGRHYKNIPVGYDSEHKNSKFLLYNGFYVDKKFDIPEEFYSSEFIDFCYGPYREMFPVQKWLSDLTKRV